MNPIDFNDQEEIFDLNMNLIGKTIVVPQPISSVSKKTLNHKQGSNIIKITLDKIPEKTSKNNSSKKIKKKSVNVKKKFEEEIENPIVNSEIKKNVKSSVNNNELLSLLESSNVKLVDKNLQNSKLEDYLKELSSGFKFSNMNKF